MKVNLPYWKKLPDSWKQTFAALGAIIAVLQAIHFIVATPVGIIEGIKYRNQVQTYTWQFRETAALNEIAAQILGRQNSPFFTGGYQEECIEILESYGEFLSDSDSSKCDKLVTLDEIVDSAIDLYEVPKDQLSDFYETLEWQLGLPIEHLNDIDSEDNKENHATGA